MPQSDLIKAQWADPTLEELCNQIVPMEQFGDVAHGYFLQDNVLMRKWVVVLWGRLLVRLLHQLSFVSWC